jgi:hypothetical protein
MKILNDIAWNLNWIEVETNWNLVQIFKFNLNTLNGIQIQLRSIGFRFSSIEFILIEEKWDTNWYRKHWKIACDLGVARKIN